MTFFSLINSTVVGLATLIVLVVIAVLLAWLVGFLYARQQRFGDDLLDVFQAAGIGSDIKRAPITDVAPIGHRSAAEKTSSRQAGQFTGALHRITRSAGLRTLARRLALLAIVTGIGFGGYQLYGANQIGVHYYLGAAQHLVSTQAIILYDQLRGVQASASTKPAETVSNSEPTVLGARTEQKAPHGPYGPSGTLPIEQADSQQ